MRAAHRLQHRMVACVGRLSSRALVVLDKCTCTSLARLAWVLMLRSEPMRWQPSWTDAGALRCLGLRSQVLSTGAPGFSPCRLVWIVVKQHIAGPTPHNGSPHGRRASGVLNVFSACCGALPRGWAPVAGARARQPRHVGEEK